jgi:hypothetical protein
MKALILTGPRDGELIDHDRPILEIVDPIHEEEILGGFKILRYKRAIFCDGDDYVPVFVPAEWPTLGVQGLVLNHLIRRAFKGAEK